MHENNIPYFRSFVHGVNIKIPLPIGKYVSEINFDNAATTPPLNSVLNEILAFSPMYSSIHRGTGFKSRYSSMLYENSRQLVAKFVGADLSKDVVIFVKNTTEAINKLSYRLEKRGRRNIILSTGMEHHSNDLPWRNRFRVDYIDIDKKGRISLKDLEYKLRRYGNNVRLVAVTGASNVTGYLNPIDKIAKLVHKYGSEILVDGAQLVAHTPVNMKPNNSNEHIDYLVFSAHKMYAPFGTGVLIGPKTSFENGSPDYTGGGTVDIVTHNYVRWAEPPHKEEAGSPNIIGVIALSAAIKTLLSLGIENIHKHEKILTKYAIEGLKSVPDIELYGDTDRYDDRVGIITFNINGIHHETLANVLSFEAGIAVRNGCFCAHPYLHSLLNVNKEVIDQRIKDPSLPHPGMVRISFGMYNNIDEINTLINALKIISSNKKYFLKKYDHLNNDKRIIS
ncbi:aminotransferase class V-fold PLP-dependent enzyme [Wukongibacter sp. M2B1]|uniref:aminotransferase class V-fold PLP-dependent enzyme n=1 Tax=Wukongibacter sp. M2B1 TaxID=3088895 RepID=UPI003D797DB0